jgi:VWFA-related protein
MRQPLKCFFAVLLSVLIGCSLDAQDPTQVAPQIKVETRMVLVDVVVTNRKGEQIPGLNQEDFRIKENGKPQVISAFEEHKPDSSAPVELPVLPSGVYTNRQAVKPNDSVNVLLIDMLNTYPWFQKAVCEQAIKFLATMPTGTRIAIFTLNDQRLRLVRGFTTDFSGLSVALNGQSAVVPEASWLNPTPQRHATEMIGLNTMIMMQAAPAAVDAVSQYLDEEKTSQGGARNELTLQAFQHLARYLSGIPARKNVVWFADSFPVSFAPDSKVHTPNHQMHVQQTSDMLTAAQVAIYPVSARGLIVDPSYDIAFNTSHELFLEYATSQTNMEDLARETGGRAFYNTNALDRAMASAIDEGAHYYALAYAPSNEQNDGKYRRIEVKFSENTYKLSYRRGYYADRPSSQEPQKARRDTGREDDRDLLIPLVGFGMPNFDQLTYQIETKLVDPQPTLGARRAGTNTELPDPVTRYAADISVLLIDVALERSNDGTKRGRLELMLVAYDRSGKIVNIAKHTTSFALTAEGETKAQNTVPIHLEIDVPVGDIYLRTGIYDLNSGNVGTLGFPLQPSAIPADSK